MAVRLPCSPLAIPERSDWDYRTWVSRYMGWGGFGRRAGKKKRERM